MNARGWWTTTLTSLALAAFALLAFAQTEGGTVAVGESEQHGPYLTDAEGNALYLFVDEDMQSDDPERMTEGVRSNAAPCANGCLQAWPPLMGEWTAGDGVDDELLYAADVDGRMQAVYNGWPLYYFVRDEAPGQTNGQGVGQAPTIWYLLTPDGTPVESGE